MATQVLATSAVVSEIINPSSAEAPSTPSGHILIGFYGAMENDEKWAIEQADVDAETTTWIPVHSNDFVTATAQPGASGTTSTVDRWMGARDANRVFEVPIGKGNIYRVRLVYKGGNAQNAQGNAISNGTVTCSWTRGETTIWA